MNLVAIRRFVTSLAGFVMLLSASIDAWAAAPKQVVLLVPGIKFDLDQPVDVWGTHQASATNKPQWSGLIGQLTASGHKFGGVVRAQGSSIQLPDCLDRTHATCEPAQATLFVLDFSAGAVVDGLAYKALELSSTLRELKRITNCPQVSLVGYSAGGLVARAYLQSALPELPFRHDVDRLITICSPHLGSAAAEHWGDFIGTRATSLQPGADLLRRLNTELDLPGDVLFASVVVRGMAIGTTGTRTTGDDYQDLFDASKLALLPLDYREGSDQIVHVCSQNLRLAACSRRYEQTHSKPVLTYIARVHDPSPGDWCYLESNVHAVAPSDASTIELVEQALRPDSTSWSACDTLQMERCVARHARHAAFALTERGAADHHSWSEVQKVIVDQVELVSHEDTSWNYKFRGQASSLDRVCRLWTQNMQVDGEFQLVVDRFGQVASCRETILSASDQ